MHIPVLVERVEANGYRARTGEPMGLVAEGATVEEAIQQLKALLAARMATGTQLVSLEVPDNPHPWAKWAGMFPDDELSEEWRQAMAERRRQVDADPDIL